MNDNGSLSLTDLFEECLAELEAGLSIDEIIASRAAFSDDLRPLLETAGAARTLHPADLSRAAQHRGRTRLLVQAERLRREKPRRARTWNWPRLALQLSAVLVIIAISLTSLVAASAQSLPGDQLYSVKRVAEGAQLNAAGEGGRDNFEDTLRERRIGEIEALLRLRRSAPVAFEGVLTEMTDTIWTIAGLETTVSDETALNGNILPGMYVEVHGRTTADGRLIADKVYLRAYAFAGTLSARNGAIWRIDDIPVLITAESQLAPDLTIGDQVVVLAEVDDAGTVSARAILLGQEALPAPQNPLPDDVSETGTPEPSPTTIEVEIPTPTPDPEPDPEADPEAEGTDDDDDDDEFETEEPDDDSDNSGSGSDGSTKEPDDDKTEDPDDD